MCARDTVRPRLAVALAGVVILGGCGDDAPQLAPIERKELHAFVDRARSAATARDLAATNAALEALQARVRGLREAGRIDPQTAARLLKYSAITQVRARSTLGSEPPAAPTAEATEPPAVPAAEPAPPAAEADPGDGNDKSKDKGKGKADGNGKGKGKARE